MTAERTHAGWQQAEADGTAAIAVVDAVDHGRQFLSLVMLEEIELMAGGRYEIEQHHADGKRFITRNPGPEPVERGEQKAGIARLVEAGFVPIAAEISDPY